MDSTSLGRLQRPKEPETETARGDARQGLGQSPDSRPQIGSESSSSRCDRLSGGGPRRELARL